MPDEQGRFRASEVRDLAPDLAGWTPDAATRATLDAGQVVSRPDDRTFPLLIPMTLPPQAAAAQAGRSSLAAVLALGPRLSDLGYSRDERILLLTLAAQVGTGIYLAQGRGAATGPAIG